MKFVYKEILLLLAILIVTSIKAQDKQILVKVGATRLLTAPTPSTKGFAYKVVAPHSPYPSLHLEFKKEKFFNERLSLLAGISGIPNPLAK